VREGREERPWEIRPIRTSWWRAVKGLRAGGSTSKGIWDEMARSSSRLDVSTASSRVRREISGAGGAGGGRRVGGVGRGRWDARWDATPGASLEVWEGLGEEDGLLGEEAP
jgi:hypothetical protein